MEISLDGGDKSDTLTQANFLPYWYVNHPIISTDSTTEVEKGVSSKLDHFFNDFWVIHPETLTRPPVRHMICRPSGRVQKGGLAISSP